MRLSSYHSFLSAANLGGVGDLAELLTGSEEVRSVASILQFNRAAFGAEFLIGWNMRDRNATAFAEFLERGRTGHL